MSRLRFITIGGLTQTTPLDELLSAHELYSGVEWSVDLSSTDCPGCVNFDDLSKIARRLRSVSHQLYLSISVPNDLVKHFFDFENIKDHALIVETFSRIHLDIEESECNRDDIEKLAYLLSRDRIQLSTANVCAQLSRCGNREILFSGVPEKHAVSHLSHEYRMKVGFRVNCSDHDLFTVIPQLNEITRLNLRHAIPYWLDIGRSAITPQGNLDFESVKVVLQSVVDITSPTIIGKKPVSKLNRLEIDWWMGMIEGYNMLTLSSDACAAVYLHRITGKYATTQVGTSWSDAGALLEKYRISVVELAEGGWQGAYLDKNKGQMIFLAKSKNYLKAGILSIVMQQIGKSIPLHKAEND